MQRAKAQVWGRFAALIAGVALLLQVMVVPPARAEAMELCTAHGTKTVLVAKDAAPRMPGDCEHCGHCVLIAPADVPALRVEAPVRYAATADVSIHVVSTAGHQARAPPRPPGQGPPTL